MIRLWTHFCAFIYRSINCREIRCPTIDNQLCNIHIQYWNIMKKCNWCCQVMFIGMERCSWYMVKWTNIGIGAFNVFLTNRMIIIKYELLICCSLSGQNICQDINNYYPWLMGNEKFLLIVLLYFPSMNTVTDIIQKIKNYFLNVWVIPGMPPFSVVWGTLSRGIDQQVRLA